jgi:hypothetical protein
MFNFGSILWFFVSGISGVVSSLLVFNIANIVYKRKLKVKTDDNGMPLPGYSRSQLAAYHVANNLYSVHIAVNIVMLLIMLFAMPATVEGYGGVVLFPPFCASLGSAFALFSAARSRRVFSLMIGNLEPATE